MHPASTGAKHAKRSKPIRSCLRIIPSMGLPDQFHRHHTPANLTQIAENDKSRINRHASITTLSFPKKKVSHRGTETTEKDGRKRLREGERKASHPSFRSRTTCSPALFTF